MKKSILLFSLFLLHTVSYSQITSGNNSLATINFSLARDGETLLKVFDIMGREIKTLAHGFVKSGVYSYQWDGTNAYSQQVATGIYFCRLQSSGNVMTKKMIFMK